MIKPEVRNSHHFRSVQNRGSQDLVDPLHPEAGGLNSKNVEKSGLPHIVAASGCSKKVLMMSLIFRSLSGGNWRICPNDISPAGLLLSALKYTDMPGGHPGAGVLLRLFW